jgi:uncharacterized protein (TIGR02996 family)
MNEETCLAALHADPTDELTWLALADWLDEDGQSQRAELVRSVRRLRALPVMKRTKPRVALENRITALLAAGVRPVVPEIVNDLGMRFALIPAGRFRMGSPSGEKGRWDQEKAHEVILTRPFYLGVFPVTQRQYQAVMGTNPSHFSRQGEGKEVVRDIPNDELANFPVETVTWRDARQFLKKLNARAESKSKRWRYRLPREAEWEYACRAGTTSVYHFGTTLTAEQACFAEDDSADIGSPRSVGRYLPNAFGLYDMHGNVNEWVANWYDDYPVGPVTDPAGPSRGSDRLVRGGSWRHADWACRSASRNWIEPGYQSYSLGFRVALVVSR